jgi:hypothetical protein
MGSGGILFEFNENGARQLTEFIYRLVRSCHALLQYIWMMSATGQNLRSDLMPIGGETLAAFSSFGTIYHTFSTHDARPSAVSFSRRISPPREDRRGF